MHLDWKLCICRSECSETRSLMASMKDDHNEELEELQEEIEKLKKSEAK